MEEISKSTREGIKTFLEHYGKVDKESLCEFLGIKSSTYYRYGYHKVFKKHETKV